MDHGPVSIVLKEITEVDIARFTEVMTRAFDDDAQKHLGTIFIDPPYQDRGIGEQCWAQIEQLYPEAKSWRLATPTWATKNHHFYQKCGFVAVESDPLIPAEEGITIYYKQVKG